MGCSGGQLIVLTPLLSALCTGRLHYRLFPPFANTAVGQLPSVWFAPPRNSTLLLPGYPSLCPPGTRVVRQTIIVSSSEAPPKLSTLLHGLARRSILPSTYRLTPYVTRFETSLRKSLSSHSPQPISWHFRCRGYPPSPTRLSELL